VKPVNSNPVEWGHINWSYIAVFSANCTLKWGHFWIRDTFGWSPGCPYFTGFTIVTFLQIAYTAGIHNTVRDKIKVNSLTQ
jgi:hypothetical protein